MVEQTMIERVARAMCDDLAWAEWNRHPEDNQDYLSKARESPVDVNGPFKCDFRSMARSAILAMRDVTPAMLSAAANTPGMSDVDKIIAFHAARSRHDALAGHSESPFAQGWKAAIDAILTEDQTNASR